MAIVKAVLSDTKGHRLEVQFNPESLRIQHATFGEKGQQHIVSGSGSGSPDAAGKSTVVTAYTSTLSSLDLLFDTSDTGDDVRMQTLLLAEMMKPEGKISPTVTFQWGTLLFEGHITDFTENLSYFSEQGVPLRAEVNISMSAASKERASNKISSANSGLGLAASASLGASIGASAGASFGASAGISGGASLSASVSASVSAGAAIGTTPLTFSQGGESLQSLSARAGLDWRVVADANNIDNPRTLQAGAVVNLNVR